MTDNNGISGHESAPNDNKQHTENPSLPQQIDAARLSRVFDTSSEKNRNFLFSFLAAELYMLIAVGSTTDLNLLLPTSSFSLPVVNVAVPIVGFYIFAPLLLLVIHANLLFNLSEHVALLKKWQEIEGNSQLRFPYLINVISYYMFSDEKSFKFTIVKNIANFAIVLLPLFILLFIQIRFSDYHQIYITFFHMVIFFVDFYILYKYITTLSIPLFHTSKNTFPIILPILMSSFSFVNIMIVGIIVMTSPSYMDPRNWKFPVIVLESNPDEPFVNLSLNSTESLELDSDDMKSKKELRKILKDNEFQTLAKTTNMLKEFLIPHLDLHEHKISKKEDQKYTYSLVLTNEEKENTSKLVNLYHKEDLEGRNLELANFNGAILFNVNLRNASLDNATLRSTKLQGANLWSTQMDNADLNNANLEGTDLRFAKLRGSNLLNARLKDADLRYARLQGANLEGANLEGANLTNAIISQKQIDKACGSRATILPKGLSIISCSKDQKDNE